MQEDVKTFQRADGKRQVHIKKRSDAGFTFVIEELVYHYDEELRERLQNYEMVWVPVNPAGGIYGTPEEAMREARGSEGWLDQP
jgi:hypothetical protein